MLVFDGARLKAFKAKPVSANTNLVRVWRNGRVPSPHFLFQMDIGPHRRETVPGDGWVDAGMGLVVNAGFEMEEQKRRNLAQE